MRAPSRRAFVASALAIPVLLLSLYLWLLAEYHRAEGLRIAAAASFERRVATVSMLAHVTDAETAQRGHVLTGDPSYLARYASAKATVRREWVKGMPDTPQRLLHRHWMVFGQLAADGFAEMDSVLAHYRAGRRDAAVRQIAEGRGRRYMQRLQRSSADLLTDEAAVLAARREAFHAQRRKLRSIVLAVIAVFTGSLMTGLGLLYRSRQQRHEALVDAVDAAKRYRTIVESAHDGLLILDPTGAIEVVNGAVVDLLGHSADELAGAHVDAILAFGDGHSVQDLSVGLHENLLARAKGGHTVTVDVASGVMQLPGGRHAVLSLRDVSERRRTERLKDDLIATVSHELRTPLTSIVGSLGLLHECKGEALSAVQAQLVGIAHANSQRLIRLVNDILDIERIGCGRLPLTKAPVDLVAITQEACRAADGIAAAPDVTIRFVRTTGPAMIHGDPGRLHQVVANLLSNAVRAAASGTAIDVLVRRDAGSAILTVEDRGAGIPADLRPRLFGRFERADVGDGVGAGLGLAISREIVHGHGGTIGFADRDGGGTRFTVTLPLDEHRAAPSRMGAAAAPVST